MTTLRKPSREPSVAGALFAGGTLGAANVVVAAVAAIGFVGVAAVGGAALGVVGLGAVASKAAKNARASRTVSGSARKAAAGRRSGRSGSGRSGLGKALGGGKGSASKGKSLGGSKAARAGGKSAGGLKSRGSSKAGAGKASKAGVGAKKSATGSRIGKGLGFGGKKSGSSKAGKSGLGKTAKGAARAGKRSGGLLGKTSGSGKGAGLFGRGKKASAATAARKAKAKAAKKAGTSPRKASTNTRKFPKVRSMARKASSLLDRPTLKAWKDKNKKKAVVGGKKHEMPKPTPLVRPLPKRTKNSLDGIPVPQNIACPSEKTTQKTTQQEVNAMAANVSGIPHPYRQSTAAIAQDTGSWNCAEGRDVLALLEGLEDLYTAQANAIRVAAVKVAQRFPNDAAFQEFISGLIRGANQYAAYTAEGRMAYVAMNQQAIAYMNGNTDQFDQSRNRI